LFFELFVGFKFPPAKFALAQTSASKTRLRSRPSRSKLERKVFIALCLSTYVLRVNDMPRYKVLAELYDELRNIRVLDRIYDYATEADPISERAHEIRQRRRRQILDEIARLKATRTQQVIRAVVGSAVGVVSVAGYAMLLYLLK